MPHPTQHIVVFDDNGNAMFALINNHGPTNAEAALHGRPDSKAGGWIDQVDRIRGRANAAVVIDIDLSDMPGIERDRMVRELHRMRGVVERGPANTRRIARIESFADDAHTQPRRTIDIAQRGRVIHAPADFDHPRYDVRGQRKDKA